MPSEADLASLDALRAGRIIVQAAKGEIWTASGARAEYLDKRLGYGRVFVRTRPLCFAMAHRVVWIAEHGLIPDQLQVNHLNRRRWDNRIANLELVTRSGNARHWRGHGYDAVSDRDDAIPTDWLDRLDGGEPAPEQIKPYARHPRAS